MRVLDLALEEDIAPLSAVLWQLRIPHRIFEEHGRQVLEVARSGDAERVAELYEAWRGGALGTLPSAQGRAPRVDWRGWIRRYPVVACVLAATVLLYPATWPLDRNVLGIVLPWLTIAPVELTGTRLVQGTLSETLISGQLWRLMTPIFLHFSMTHLAFNVALFAGFGRRIEAGAGSATLLATIVVSGIVSNVVQFLWGSTVLFGGLSGVVYGLFGYVVVQARFGRPPPLWALPPAFVVAMLVLLIAMSTGMTEPFGLVVANAAHWSGLGTGCGLAVMAAWQERRSGG